ncbi:uncharacterized protein C8R40DRAFT_1118019, partial [Lentinula edodes]|uniref:uncharacterized protein n=1 Tax=Lentinula edodes TaxID=5353 RepID=UPI001E8DD6C2
MANSSYSGYNPNSNLNIPYSSYDGGRGYGFGHGPERFSDSKPENPYGIQEQEQEVGPHSSYYDEDNSGMPVESARQNLSHPENPADNYCGRSGHSQHPLGPSSQNSRVYNPSSELPSSFVFSSLGPTRPAQVPSEREHPRRDHFPQTSHTNDHLNQLKQSRDSHNDSISISHVSNRHFSDRYHHHDGEPEWDHSEFPGRRQPEVPNGIAGTPRGSGYFDNNKINRDGSAASVRPLQGVEASTELRSGSSSSSSSGSAKSNNSLPRHGRRAPSMRVVVPSYTTQQELVHWDETLHRRSEGGLGSGSGSAWLRECVDSKMEMGGSNSNLMQTETPRTRTSTLTLTENLIACGAKELQEIFEIWEEVSCSMN